MKNLLTGIMTKTAGSTLSTAVGGRIYFEPAPPGAEFPYVVVDIIYSSPDDPFSGSIESTLIQFSIYSEAGSAVEIADIYTALKALFKDCELTITGGTNIAFEQVNLVTMNDEITTPNGVSIVRHWAVDYSVIVES